MKKAIIFDIKHFAVHDGPGIRTTLFFKGCPLSCLWCHNPESISKNYQLSYLEYKCTNCQRCAFACENGVHVFENGHTLLRENCIYCGKCEKACSAGALTLYGREINVAEAFDELIEDVDFYGETGGVTLSGGECLMQADFCKELLQRLKAEGINTALDTSGFAKREALEKIIPYTDLFLFDIKAFNEDVHIKCTGASNKIIFDNIKYLDSLGKEIEVRIPYIPDCNSQEIEKIGDFLSHLKSVKTVRVLPYHNYAKSKYKALDMPDTSPERLPNGEQIKKAREILASFGLNVLD